MSVAFVVVTLYKRYHVRPPRSRDPGASGVIRNYVLSARHMDLSDEQQEALNTLRESFDSEEAAAEALQEHAQPIYQAAYDDGHQDGLGEAEGKASRFKEQRDELEEEVEALNEEIEQLREENEELKSELQDLKQIQEVKNDLDEVKSILDDVKLEDGPRAQQEQKRGDNMSGEDSKTGWKQKAEGMKSFLKRDESYVSDFAENHDIKSEEVNQFIND